MTPAKSPLIAHRTIQGEGFIVDSRNGGLHHLNATAADIWGWIDGSRDEEQLVGLLCERYEIGRPQAEADVRQLLAELAEQDLIMEAAHAL